MDTEKDDDDDELSTEFFENAVLCYPGESLIEVIQQHLTKKAP